MAPVLAKRPRHLRTAGCARAVWRLQLWAAAACVCALSFSSTARASEPSSTGAREVRGCEALAASHAQQPEPSAQVELAECYAQVGRSATAWEHYREAARLSHAAGMPELESLARDRAKALESELSYVTVNTWRGQAVTVTQDGAPIDAAVLGTAIPLDPGSHTISATAPGKRGWSKRIELGTRGDHVTVAVPVLPDDARLTPELNASTTPPPPAAPAREGSASVSVQRTMAIVAGAIGIAGVATGTLFGVKAASDWSDTKDACKAFPYCGEEGARLGRQAKSSALISTVGFVTGVAGLSGGALLWFTSRSSEQNATQVGVGLGAVHVRGPL